MRRKIGPSHLLKYFLHFSNRYKDIGELMKRCETLIATRDNLSSNRDKIRNNIQQEEEALAQFKEEQNAKILGIYIYIFSPEIRLYPEPIKGCWMSNHIMKSGLIKS